MKELSAPWAATASLGDPAGQAPKKMAPVVATGAGKPYRCHHGKAPAQGGKAGDNGLAAIIRRPL